MSLPSNRRAPFVSVDREDVTSDTDKVTGMTPVKLLKSGDSYYSFDAGMFIPASINGTKWHDLNADGFKQCNEFGLASNAITLYDDDGDFTCQDYTTHDPSRKVFTMSPKPANVTSKADFDLFAMKSTAKIFEGGSSFGGFFDAGMYLPATVGDQIWFDDTPNGIQKEASQDHTWLCSF